MSCISSNTHSNETNLFPESPNASMGREPTDTTLTSCLLQPLDYSGAAGQSVSGGQLNSYNNQDADPQLSSCDLLQKFHGMHHGGEGGQESDHSPTKMMMGYTLPSLGASDQTPELKPQAAPKLRELDSLSTDEHPHRPHPVDCCHQPPQGLHVDIEDHSPRNFMSVNDDAGQQLSSSTLVVLSGGKSKRGSGNNSGKSSILPTPSGAHSGKQKIVFMDSDHVEDAMMAREWKEKHDIQRKTSVELPLSASGHYNADDHTASPLGGGERYGAHRGSTSQSRGEELASFDSTSSNSKNSLSHEMGKRPT